MQKWGGGGGTVFHLRYTEYNSITNRSLSFPYSMCWINQIRLRWPFGGSHDLTPKGNLREDTEQVKRHALPLDANGRSVTNRHLDIGTRHTAPLMVVIGPTPPLLEN